MKRKGKTLDPKLKFGEHLKALIIKAGWESVEKFALANSLNRVTLWRIVEQGSDPQLSTLIQILKGLEISPNELIRLK